MPNIAAIDSNFKVNTTIDKPDIRFYDVQEAPFAVYGLRCWAFSRRCPETPHTTSIH